MKTKCITYSLVLGMFHADYPALLRTLNFDELRAELNYLKGLL